MFLTNENLKNNATEITKLFQLFELQLRQQTTYWEIYKNGHREKGRKQKGGKNVTPVIVGLDSKMILVITYELILFYRKTHT